MLNEKTRTMLSAGAGLGGLSTAVGALMASACCWGPGLLSVLGVSGVIAATPLAPFRHYLLGTSSLLLGAGFWLAYRPPRTAGACCPLRRGRWTRGLLWFSVGVVAISAALPYLVA